MSLVLLPTQQTLLDKYLTSMARDTVLLKQSSTAESSFALAGRLFVSGSGWLLLSVPNSLVRGAFDAMDELGVELPSGSDGRLNAHISVMTSDELASIGPDKVSERGHMFHYTLGRVKSAVPEGWPEIGKVWFIEIYSPELQNLHLNTLFISQLQFVRRKSYKTMASTKSKLSKAKTPKRSSGNHDFNSEGLSVAMVVARVVSDMLWLIKYHGYSWPSGSTFNSMMYRMTCITCPQWARYGARLALDACFNRKLDKNAFNNWACEVGPRPPGTSLERVDNNKGYVKGNLIWADAVRQARNKANTTRVHYKNKDISYQDWAELQGIPAELVLTCLKQRMALKQIRKVYARRLNSGKVKGKVQNPTSVSARSGKQKRSR
jgi:hypothetical protein